MILPQCILLILCFIQFNLASIAMKHVYFTYPPCIDIMKLPCSMYGANLIAVEDYVQQGLNGEIHLAIAESSGEYYIVKFATITDDELEWNEHVEDEIEMTKLLSQNCPRNSVRLFCSDKKRYEDHTEYVMVMEYYPFGDASKVLNSDQINHELLIQYRDGHIIKFLSDMRSVLKTMWNLEFIDRDFKLQNVLITGDLSRPETTNYIKIDYGTVISAENAEIELIDKMYRKLGFCHFGSNVEYLYNVPLPVFKTE